MKTKRQLEGDAILNFARSTIIKPTDTQLLAFTKRLHQIMTRDNTLHPETLARGKEVVEIFSLKSCDPKDLAARADAEEKIHHRIKDADYLRAFALCMRAYHATTDYDRITFAARACVKALYCCGLTEEIKTALMLVF